MVITQVLDATKAARSVTDRGGRYAACKSPAGLGAKEIADWVRVPALHGVIQHEARSRIRSELQKYLFASCFAK
jgi:DNA (cytosine-5)-methyltransferase 1